MPKRLKEDLIDRLKTGHATGRQAALGRISDFDPHHLECRLQEIDTSF